MSDTVTINDDGDVITLVDASPALRELLIDIPERIGAIEDKKDINLSEPESTLFLSEDTVEQLNEAVDKVAEILNTVELEVGVTVEDEDG